jgi:hypothetical protein
MTTTGAAAFQGALNASSTLAVSGQSYFQATTTHTGSLSVSSTQIFEPFYWNATTSASSTSIDWNNGNKQGIVLGTASTTLNFAHIQSGASYSLWLSQDGTGSRIVTWATSTIGRVLWAGAAVPTLSTASNTMDEFSFQCFVPQTTTTLSCYGQYGTNGFAQ